MQYCKSISCAKINAVLLQKCYNKGGIAKVLQELLHYINNKCNIAKVYNYCKNYCIILIINAVLQKLLHY